MVYRVGVQEASRSPALLDEHPELTQTNLEKASADMQSQTRQNDEAEKMNNSPSCPAP